MHPSFLILTKEFTKKNFLLAKRSKRNFYIGLLMPVLICLSIFYVQYLIENTKSKTKTPNPIPEKIDIIPKCYKPKNCTSIGYFIIGETEPWIDQVMQKIAESNRLDFTTEVKLLLQGSPDKIVQYVKNHQNQTQIAVIFCTSNWDISYNNLGISVPCNFEQTIDQKLVFYSIYYNMTLGFEIPYFFKLNAPFPINKIAISLKKSLDQALIQQFTNSTNFEFNFRSVSFPSTENKFLKDYDFVSNFGAFFFYLPLAVF